MSASIRPSCAILAVASFCVALTVVIWPSRFRAFLARILNNVDTQTSFVKEYAMAGIRLKVTTPVANISGLPVSAPVELSKVNTPGSHHVPAKTTTEPTGVESVSPSLPLEVPMSPSKPAPTAQMFEPLPRTKCPKQTLVQGACQKFHNPRPNQKPKILFSHCPQGSRPSHDYHIAERCKCLMNPCMEGCGEACPDCSLYFSDDHFPKDWNSCKGYKCRKLVCHPDCSSAKYCLSDLRRHWKPISTNATCHRRDRNVQTCCVPPRADGSEPCHFNAGPFQHIAMSECQCSEQSCQRCLAGGRNNWPPGATQRWNRMYEITNVEFDHGKLVHPRDITYSKCLTSCRPSLGTFGDYKEFYHQDIAQGLVSKKVVRPMSCKSFFGYALVTSIFFPLNLYHFVFDSIYVHYLSVMEYSRYLKQNMSTIQMFALAPITSDRKKYPYHELWLHIFNVKKLPNLASVMHGCYASVLIGTMNSARFTIHSCTHMNLVRDTAAMSWMMMFGKHARTSLNSSTTTAPGNSCTLHLGFIYHHRVPEIFVSNWSEKPLPMGACIQKYHMEKLPITAQAAAVMKMQGMISLEGAAFTWQIWMEPMAHLLELALPSAKQHYKCKALPETWHANAAVHSGHLIVNWRFCGTTAAFLEASPMKVVEFMLRLGAEARKKREARACFILYRPPKMCHARPKDPNIEWPWCDIDLSLPHPKHVEPVKWCGKYDVQLEITNR